MFGEYLCPYIHNSGVACSKPCMHSEGCSFHWKAKNCIPCSDCGKPTVSISGCCPLHIRGFYVTQYYQRLHVKASEKCISGT